MIRNVREEWDKGIELAEVITYEPNEFDVDELVTELHAAVNAATGLVDPDQIGVFLRTLMRPQPYLKSCRLRGNLAREVVWSIAIFQ